MSVVITEQGQILQTSDGTLLESGGPFQHSTGGRPTIATNSVPFSSAEQVFSLAMLDGRSLSFTKLYRSQPWVAIAVNKLTRQIARLPLKVYEKNSQDERQRVTDHRLVDLIREPAPRCGPSQLKQWLTIPTLLHGNATLLKGRAERFGPPTRLYPLDWRYMTPQIEDSWVQFWRCSEFGKALPLDPDDVVHLGWEAPDGRIGVSPLEQLGITVQLEQSAQDYQASYMRQGARPPSALKMPEGVVLDADTRRDMKADLIESAGGSGNAGLPWLLPGNIDWVTVAHSAHEAELIDQRRLTREEIAAAYDIPPPMIGILDRATFSNVTEQHRMLFTTVLGPWLSLIEEAFQRQIIDPEPAFAGLFVEFDLAEVLKGDKLKEIQSLREAVLSGLLTLNEAREIQNRKAYEEEWAKHPMVPANNLGTAPQGAAGAEGDPSAFTPSNGNGNGADGFDPERIAEAVYRVLAGSN